MACIFVDNKDIDASSMRVETLNGTIMLSGFAKNATEKSTAQSSRAGQRCGGGQERDRRTSLAPSRHHRRGRSGTSCTAGHATPHPMTRFVLVRGVREV